jgi:hypothetical protein
MKPPEGTKLGRLNLRIVAVLLRKRTAMQGEREKSRKAYDEFFTTWKNADPDIPVLRQAKAEYRKVADAAPVAAATSEKEQ